MYLLCIYFTCKSTCKHLCMYLYVYIFTHAHTHTHTHLRLHVNMRAHKHSCTYLQISWICTSMDMAEDDQPSPALKCGALFAPREHTRALYTIRGHDESRHASDFSVYAARWLMPISKRLIARCAYSRAAVLCWMSLMRHITLRRDWTVSSGPRLDYNAR